MLALPAELQGIRRPHNERATGRKLRTWQAVTEFGMNMKLPLNLKNVIVEHRPIRRAAISLRLPMPPSVNNLYATVAHGRIPTERYKQWRAAAGNAVVQAHYPHISGPVEISITFEEPARLSDIDNRAKAPLDLLVSMRVIDGDDSRTLRKLTLAWGTEKGALIRIVPSHWITRKGLPELRG